MSKEGTIMVRTTLLATSPDAERGRPHNAIGVLASGLHDAGY